MSRASDQNYVDGSRGWKVFFFAFALACFAGLSVRLYFNPERIRDWLDDALQSQGAAIGLRFKGARLELSRGSIPQFAVMMTDVVASPSGDCGLEPSLKIAKLRVPLSFAALLRGRAAVGVVSAEDLIVDLDGLKRRCEKAAEKKPDSKPTEKKRAIAEASGGGEPASAWWSPEQISNLRDVVGGFEFSRVELQFENKTKKVYLRSFTTEAGEQPGEVRLAAAIEVPPELAFGEKVPPLMIEATAFPMAADVVVRAAVSEGNLVINARLVPGRDRSIDVDSKLELANIPLSTLVPLAVKSGVVTGTFRPRFLWMNCKAAIKGRFQGLFAENPLELSACELEGNGSRVRVAKATRLSNGQWQPFNIFFEQVDIAQLMDTFDWQGLSGVFQSYGRFNGEGRLLQNGHAELEATIEGAELRVSNRSLRAVQGLKKLKTKLTLRNENLTGEISDFELQGGEFDGVLAFQLDRAANKGAAHLSLRKMRLSDEVNRVFLGGPVEDVNGKAEARIDQGKLSSLKGLLTLRGVAGDEVRAPDATVQVGLGKGDAFELHWRAPHLALRKGSALYEGLRPTFFAHEFADEWVAARDVNVESVLPPSGGLEWTSARAEFEGGRIKLSSEGSFTRDRVLSGWVSLDYPAAKKLRWKLSGSTSEVNLIEDSKSLAEFKARARFDDAALGLPVSRAGAKTAEAPSGFRALGEKVMRRARGLMPKPAVEATKSDATTAPSDQSNEK